MPSTMLPKSISILSLFLVSPVLSQTTDIPTAITTAQPQSSAALAPPSCASACIQQATEVQVCAGTDNKCLCQHSSSVQAAISSCLAQSAGCTASETSEAIAFYPQVCALLGYKTTTSTTAAANALVTAAGTAPTNVHENSAVSLVLTSTGTPGINNSLGSRHNNQLSQSAIIGITFAAVTVFVLVVGLCVWVVYRHRCSSFRPSPGYDTEHGLPSARQNHSLPTSDRHTTRKSSVAFESSDPIDDTLSRSNTLVSGRPSMAVSLDKPLPEIQPPMPAIEPISGSLGKRGSSIKTAKSLLLGAKGRIRASVLSTHTPRARHNLREEALSISRVSDYSDTMPK